MAPPEAPRPFSEPTLIRERPDPDLTAELERLDKLGFGDRVSLRSDGPSMVSIIIQPKIDPAEVQAQVELWGKNAGL